MKKPFFNMKQRVWNNVAIDCKRQYHGVHLSPSDVCWERAHNWKRNWMHNLITVHPEIVVLWLCSNDGCELYGNHTYSHRVYWVLSHYPTGSVSRSVCFRWKLLPLVAKSLCPVPDWQRPQNQSKKLQWSKSFKSLDTSVDKGRQLIFRH